MLSLKKLKAFTLSELSVVLLLTSIVVGLAFTVLGLVQKQMGIVKANFNTTLELNKLETELWLDFNRYPSIRFNDIENRLVLRNELDSVSYILSESFIVKHLDTLPILIKNKYFYFDGKQTTTHPIDAMKLITTKASQSRELFIYIKNDATLYMNTNGIFNH